MVPATCSNCRHYLVSITELPPDYRGVIYRKESSQRCGLGGFAVKKQGWCREYEKRLKKGVDTLANSE